LIGLLHLCTLLSHVVSETMMQGSQPYVHRQTGTGDHACQQVRAWLDVTTSVSEMLMSCDLLQTLLVSPEAQCLQFLSIAAHHFITQEAATSAANRRCNQRV